MKKALIYFFITFLFFVTAAQANGASSAAAAGGIKSAHNPSIILQREQLTISHTAIKAAYVYHNNSDQAITTELFFPLPSSYKPQSIHKNTDSISNTHKKNEDLPFLNFSVLSDGNTVEYHATKRAILGDEDITQKLEDAHIPTDPSLIGPKVHTHDKTKHTWMKKARAMHLLDKKHHARWQERTVFYWQQTFPAHQDLLIEYQYKPAAGLFQGDNAPNQSLNEKMTKNSEAIQNIFNLKLDQLQDSEDFKNWLVQRIQRTLNNENPVYAYFYNVDFLLPTDSKSKKSLPAFTLKIIKPTEGAIAYNKFYGNAAVVKKDENQNIDIFIENFKPKKNLNILFASIR